MSLAESITTETHMSPIAYPANIRLLIIRPTPTPTWLSNLALQLIRFGCKVNYTATSNNLSALCQQYETDIIISTNESHFLNLTTPHPLRILISNNPTHPPSIADFISPPNAATLISQMRYILKMRAENQQLTEENNRQSKLLEQQDGLTEELDLLKNAIVRNVSHELKTPLLHIKSAVSMLAEDNQDNPLIKYATEATARLSEIVKNITQLASSLDNEFQAVQVHQLVDNAMRNVRRNWEHKNGSDRIIIDQPPSLPPVYADLQGISTVIQLLLDNALKFSEGEIKLTITPQTEHIKINIQDSGIGIQPDQLDKIFASFYQIDNSSTRRYGGTGIGLALVRLILDRHQIKIHVESTPDKGSTFYFELPLYNHDKNKK